MKAIPHLSREMQRRVWQLAKEDAYSEFQKYKHIYFRQLYKVFCIALSEEFGFGESRLKRILDKAEALFSEYEHDEIYWEHVDKILSRYNLGFENEDYDNL